MRLRIFKRSVMFCLLLGLSLSCKAQSTVMEISWNVYDQNYTGLLVLYPNNRGLFKVKSFTRGVGLVWVTQDAVLSSQYDAWGNCTQFINCYNPRTTPYVPYSADNFAIFPNGSMYTQDASGTWSTAIAALVIPPHNWQQKFIEYNIR